MNVALLKDSKFLRKEDVGEDGTVLTIRSITQENVAQQGAEPEMKWCIHFDEVEKPCVINNINAQMIAKLTGADDTDEWPGHKITLYSDPSVSFGGRLIGGIRVRAAQKQAASAQPRSVPVSGPVSNRTILKQKLKQHPEFNKTLMPQAVNEYCINKWGAKVDELSEDAAQEAIDGFALLVNDCLDDIPF